MVQTMKDLREAGVDVRNCALLFRNSLFVLASVSAYVYVIIGVQSIWQVYQQVYQFVQTEQEKYIDRYWC